MSSSSLWVMNDKSEGAEITKFRNSWLFSPISMQQCYLMK